MRPASPLVAPAKGCAKWKTCCGRKIRGLALCARVKTCEMEDTLRAQ